MPSGERFEIALLPGSRELLSAHANALPQRDDLCGAFCGALALRAGGVDAAADDAALDQDAVALAAGSVVSEIPDPSILPSGEMGRRDYRLDLPTVADATLSGTTTAGVLAAIEELSEGRLAAVPYSGPWRASMLAGLFELAASLERPVTLIANHSTRHLWGSHPNVGQLLAYLAAGVDEGPPPDWEVGHFACMVARVRGDGGALYVLADTYPALGLGGVHVQPQERLTAALERRGESSGGGVIAVVDRADAAALRAGADALGLRVRAWDNGTLASETLA